MAIDVFLKFLPDILLLTKAPLFVWFDGTIIMYYVLQCRLFCYVWWLCMAINISVQYNGGLLSDIIILLTRGYYHRGTRLNTM